MTTRASELWIAGRMLGWLLVLPLLKRMMPLPALVAMMRRRPSGVRCASVREVERLSSIARWLALHAWPRRAGTCLEQSLVLYRFLCARAAAPELVIGVTRAADMLGAHAWVVVDGRPVGHAPQALADFSAVVTFGADGKPSDRAPRVSAACS